MTERSHCNYNFLDVTPVNVSLHRGIRNTVGLNYRRTWALNKSSLFVIITVVAFARCSFLDSRDNEVVQKVKWGHVKWTVS